MLNSIHMFPNEKAEEFNDEFLHSENDISIPDMVVMAMKEFECIENIEILGYEIITEPDLVDINEHSININYKRKTGAPEIPKYKYLSTNRVGEIKFTIRISTNLNSRVIVKKILIPIEHDGSYDINNKRWKAYWQLVDASTYSQRGRITLKSRMPIIIYQTKNRTINDYDGNVHIVSTYSYALNPKARRGAVKARVKFINPIMIFAAKIGIERTIEFFGLKDTITIVKDTDNDKEFYYYFCMNSVLFKVDKYIFENVKFVQSFCGMLYYAASNEFPVTYDVLEDREYWQCRIGYIGSAKSKNLYTFLEKGKTSVYMIERLLDTITQTNLRLPDVYNQNIYYILRWMIMDFSTLKSRSNMDVANKRIRKNEYIVNSSLGRKINDNINKIIEKMSKSKLNTMDTLLEMFNFPSDIIVNGMRNIGDLVKSDELVNDLTWLQDIYYSSKGPNSLGEQSSKMISQKYRSIDPSYIGRIDVNVSSNSDVGMSGAFVPFVKLYDNFYFTPEKEPCTAMYDMEKKISECYSSGNCAIASPEFSFNFDSFDEYIKWLGEGNNGYFEGLEPYPIRIVEKLPEEAPQQAVALQMEPDELERVILENSEEKGTNESDDSTDVSDEASSQESEVESEIDGESE